MGKRKANGLDRRSAEDRPIGYIDPVTNQRAAFPVEDGELPDGPPVDGMQYLRMVRLEAESRPDFVYIESTTSQLYTPKPRGYSREGSVMLIADAKSEQEACSDYDSDDCYVDCAIYAHPDNCDKDTVHDQWVQSFLDKFILLRKQCQDAVVYDLPYKIPVKESDWRAFILSRDIAPTPSSLACLSQERKIQWLAWFEQWLSIKTIGLEWCWIFSILASLDTTLSSNEISVLRQVAKKCISVKNELQSEAAMEALEATVREEGLQVLQAGLNITIQIVGSFYRQHDLLECR